MAPSLSAHFLSEAEVIYPPSHKSKPVTVPEYEPVYSTSEKRTPSTNSYRWKIVWRNLIAFVYLHASALYGLYLILTFNQVQLSTVFTLLILGFISAEGVTAGAHRLWSHRTYSAKWPLRLLLMLAQTMAFQNHIYEWVRDHRVHHKFTDEDADPHNSRRGFFFSHMGWLLVRKHPDVKLRGRTVDMSDLDKDWVVMFQMKYYLILMPVCCFLIPALIPWYFFNETWSNSWYVSAMLRYTLSLHFTWLVNSAAHIWGVKPYDKNISPTENPSVSVLTFGEGWHNYHHTFPWDYKAAELGNYSLNLTTGVIDMFARIGWAYDLKTTDPELIRKRSTRTGDGTRQEGHGHSHENQLYGWNDKDMTIEDRMMPKIK
uniref:Acyl-CoA Delta(11) desaturase n=1 Tax=Cacopsylla melanoneura TaxID=428564 RepID=A0A8D8V0D8_9HEMI